MAKYLVTGSEGFIGSHLCDRLLELGHKVIGMDNRVTGYHNHSINNPNYIQMVYDFSKPDQGLFDNADLRNVEAVFHLAANADVRHGFEHPRKDLEQNTIATFNVLEMMRKINCQKIVFSSTAAIYGDIGTNYYLTGIPESCEIPKQTSLYGASKLACEGLIQAYCTGFGFQSWIYRFSSIIGERYSHGFIYDFYKQLKKDPTKLYVVGGKKQFKTYVYVKDCVEGLLTSLSYDHFLINPILNIGHDTAISLTDSIPVITRYLGINPQIEWSGQSIGWAGDSKNSFLSIEKIKNLGWKPTVSIPEGIVLTLKWLQENEWILDKRGDL